MNEEVLIEKCIQSDATAQKLLYETYAPLMMSVCARYVKDRMIAEDVLQEGFIKVFTGLKSYTASGSGNVGKTGSMARFSIYKDYLYAVTNTQMHILDLKGETPERVSQPIRAGWDVETIFSYKDCMYLGTRTGMIIYSVADPLKPDYASRINHIYGCDPVVVEDDLAYVTVWSGNACGQNINELFIVDVSDIYNPHQIVSYSMKSPKGLGIDNGTLFVCDDGLKVFDAADPQKIMSNQLAHYKGMDGYDVILHNQILMMIADDGLYQYNYADLKNIHLLSKLSFEK